MTHIQRSLSFYEPRSQSILFNAVVDHVQRLNRSHITSANDTWHKSTSGITEIYESRDEPLEISHLIFSGDSQLPEVRQMDITALD